MSNTHRKKQPAPPSESLGELPKGPYDSGLHSGSGAGELRVGAKPAATPPPAEERLVLPRGVLVAMRRSGGLKFRSRLVLVYRDGRVNYDDGEGGGARTIWTLSDAELAKLRAALGQIDFAALPASSGRQNPDAFAYEIAARPSRRAYAVEALQGSIPPALAPLIDQLKQLAPLDEGDSS